MLKYMTLGLKPGKVDRWLTTEEEEALLVAAGNRMNGQLKEIITLGLNTGMSQEEIINLRWQNIDLSRRILITTREKTSVTRTLPLNGNALVLLSEKSKGRSLSGYVFFNGANRKLDRAKLKGHFKRAMKASGIAHFRFHDLRHTFATRMVQAGVDIYKVSKLLGHKDIATTQRYTHHYPESLRSGVEVLDTFSHKSVTVANQGNGSGVTEAA